ncbi:hypothetical protein [Hahella sp. NBU794]|uniref:hypothetical protein n=1 Tax=Hahella sp. NBU794 TaxID=3422590 RepID=UPI003D7002B0
MIAIVCVLLNGCAVSFDKSKIKEIKGEPISLNSSDCRLLFKVHVLPEEYQKKGRINPDDYIDWTKEVFNKKGCVASLATEEKESDMIITVIDSYVYSGAGAGIIAALTLYVIPLKETSANRQVKIEYGESIRTFDSETNVWVGWYFLPFFPASFFNYDKYIFKDHLEEFISEKR